MLRALPSSRTPSPGPSSRLASSRPSSSAPQVPTLKVDVVLVGEGQQVVALVPLDRLDEVSLRVDVGHLDTAISAAPQHSTVRSDSPSPRRRACQLAMARGCRQLYVRCGS